MTNTLSFTYKGTSTDPFDEFFIDTHGGTKATWEDEEDVDECNEDLDFNDPESY